MRPWSQRRRSDMNLSLSAMARLAARYFTEAMTPNTEKQKMTLVLGGTGTTGRRVAERLTAHGIPVRVGSRSGAPPFDWDDQATWAPALRNVESAYLVYSPDLLVPGAVEAVRRFAALAVAGGTRRLVLLSGRGEDQAQHAEQAVRESGADWTIVRSSFFAQNFSEKFFLESILRGNLALPVGHVTEPFIDVDDIADVIVAALTQHGHIGQLYEVTGPRLLTFSEAVSEIAKAAGREVSYQSVSLEQFASALIEGGVPGDYVAVLTEVASVVLDGRNSYLTDGVQRALGRRPRDFSDYARDAAATGVWNG